MRNGHERLSHVYTREEKGGERGERKGDKREEMLERTMSRCTSQRGVSVDEVSIAMEIGGTEGRRGRRDG